MNIKLTRSMWLSNPTSALTLDPDNAEAFFGAVVLSGPAGDTSMKEYGWVNLGHADLSMTVTLSQTEMLQHSLEACQRKLSEMDAEHQRKRMVMQEAINKLQSLGWSGSKKV